MPTRTTWRPGREGATLYAYPDARRADEDATHKVAPARDTRPAPSDNSEASLPAWTRGRPR